MEHWELAYHEIATDRRRRNRMKSALRLGGGAVLFMGMTSALIAAAVSAVG